MKRKLKKIKKRYTPQTKNLIVRVTPELYSMLEGIAVENEVTISDLVRDAIRERFVKKARSRVKPKE